MVRKYDKIAKKKEKKRKKEIRKGANTRSQCYKKALHAFYY